MLIFICVIYAHYFYWKMAEKETKNKKKVQSSAMLTTIDTKNSRNVSKAKNELANSNSNKKAPVKSKPKASNDAKSIVKEKIAIFWTKSDIKVKLSGKDFIMFSFKSINFQFLIFAANTFPE